ncbi:MAG: hypothetical protein ACKOYL_08435, partial [Actinomycetota bacterium]
MSDASFNFQDLYHVGVRTANIDKAMAELGKSLRLTWAEVQVREQPCYIIIRMRLRIRILKLILNLPLINYTYTCNDTYK